MTKLHVFNEDKYKPIQKIIYKNAMHVKEMKQLEQNQKKYKKKI